MSFPRYPSYKPSGVEWLGDVPEHWEVERLGSIFRPVDEAGDDYLSILSVSIHDGVSDKELDEKEMDRKVTRSEDRSKYKKVLPGDLVYNMMRAWQGGFGTVSVPGMVSPAYVVARPTSNFSTSFVEGLLRTPQAIEQMRRYSQGVTDFRLRLYWEEFKTIRVVLPPFPEQTAIATFLGRETGKIDELVAEQRRLMELLKEKRQAVISHAVTRGLNPAAPLKPSGIEWLGDVPAHWDVSKMKWIARMESGHTPDKKIAAYWENGDIPWVSLNDTGYLKENDYISETAHSITEAGIENSSAHLLPPRAVVFSRDATIGRCAITTRPMAVSQHFIAWVCGEAMIPEFLLMRLRSMTHELDRLTTGATVKTIGMPEVRTLLTPVPPVEEQKEIITFVSSELDRIDTLTAEAQRAIDLLQERRTALISAAVTGQIDVRPTT